MTTEQPFPGEQCAHQQIGDAAVVDGPYFPAGKERTPGGDAAVEDEKGTPLPRYFPGGDQALRRQLRLGDSGKTFDHRRRP